tara:strand:+ start:183 stop:794 length:612 start_codon:yes stop_codon:yes gene_type:complete
MREMPHGQWVAFDASTETPHKCGRKTKPDPDIERLAKKTRKEQEEEEAIVLKRYGIKIENGEPVSIDSDTNADKINSKIEEATSTNTFVTESAKVLDEKKYTKHRDIPYSKDLPWIEPSGKNQEKTDYISPSSSSNISSESETRHQFKNKHSTETYRGTHPITQQETKKENTVFSKSDNLILKIVGALILGGFLFGLLSSLSD